MRARLKVLVFASVIPTTVTAQNEFMIYPERNGSAATYSSRTSNQKVEQFMEVSANNFQGVGDGGGACLAFGMYHWATDEDAASQESFSVIFRKPGRAPGPDTSAAGVIAKVGPFMLPTGTGRAGWRIVTSFSRPVQLPCTGGFFMGIELDADNWPSMDGHSIWDARYNPPANRAIGDNPRQNAPQHAWSNLSGTTRSYPWSWRMGVLVRAPIVNPGSIDPNSARQTPLGSTCWGAGGLYPDIGGNPRRDGLEMRIEDSANPNGIGIALLALRFSTTPTTVPGINGRLHVLPGFLLAMGFSGAQSGVSVVRIAAPRVLPTSFVNAAFTFQGLVRAPSGQLGFTNATIVRY